MPEDTIVEIGSEFRAGVASWMKDLPPVEPTKAPEGDGAEKVIAPAEPKPPTPPAPQPKPEEKTVEKKAEVDTEAAVPRTSREWTAFKEQRNAKYKEFETTIGTHVATISDLNKQIETLTAKASSVPADYDQVKKERDQFEGIIRQISVENHPKFKAYYDGAVKNQITLAKNIVGAEKAEELEKLLLLPDSQFKTSSIEDLIQELPMLQQTRIGSVINQLDAIKSERETEIAKSKENFTAMQNQEAEKRQAGRKQLETSFESSVKKLQGKDGSPLFQARDGDKAWNDSVDQRIGVAKALLFSNMKPEQIIQAALDAASLPVVLAQGRTMFETIKKLEKQIADMTAATPSLDGSRKIETGNGSAPTPPQAKAGSRPMEVLRDTWLKDLPAVGKET